jgi:hypothetical protein
MSAVMMARTKQTLTTIIDLPTMVLTCGSVLTSGVVNAVPDSRPQIILMISTMAEASQPIAALIRAMARCLK